MSSTPKDSKPKADDNPASSDLNVLDDDSTTPTTKPATLDAPASSTLKAPGSPQVTNETTVLAENHDDDDDDDDDLEVHPAVAPVVAHTEETPSTTTLPSTAAPDVTTTQTQSAPTSEREAKLAILTEAFPTVDREVCEFVLESHRGNVEASINALLEISDPEFQPEPQQVAPAPVPAVPVRVPSSDAPPALPRRQEQDGLEHGVANMNLNQSQTRQEIDPILLASTSTPEQQLRADEDFARTLAAMDEYRARDRQNVHNQPNQQQGNEGPSFATEIKELMDEELPKIKERFNVAADTTKKKVSEWYNQFKANRAEASQREAAQRAQQGNASQGQFNDSYRSGANNNGYSADEDRSREPIRFGSRLDEDEPLARNRVTPPLEGSTPALPARPYNVDGVRTAAATDAAPTDRRTTIEDELEFAMNTQPTRR
ncbi:ubiquitin-binding protein cue5 [Mortierella antarctica]|nr:ubiquitin-binding protein cue5 [Mortierella antarctica]